MHKYSLKYHNDEDERNQKKSDLLEDTIGSFGRWQFMISLCMALLKLPIAWFQLGIVFLAPPTDFWCRQPEDYKSYEKDKWLDLIKPFNVSSYENSATPNRQRCVMRNIELPTDKWTVQPCKWGLEFDRSVFTSSIISEWGLVCGKEHYVDLTQTVLMFGVLVGNALFGTLADKYGRKTILIVCIVMQSTCSLLSAWAPWIEMFLALRFFMAMANGGTMIVSFVMCMEVVGGRWRSVVPILYQIPFGLGNTMMALVAYYIRSWREFQIVLSFLSGAFMIYAWIIPESPRWLMAMGRRKEACEILEKAAEMNDIGVMRVRSRFLDWPRNKRPESTPGFLTLIRTPTLRQRTIILTINWFMCGMTLYGFTQYLGHLGSNIYFNVSVGGLITIPGTLLCVFVISKCGRRWTILFSNLFIACCFLSILLIPVGSFANDWPRVIFAALGVLGLSISTPTLYLYTGELYPTVIRNVGVGACIMFSRIGSMLSPFVVSTGQSVTYLPLVLLASFALLQSILVLPLPESENVLADTISDVEMGVVVRTDRCNSGDSGLYETVPDDNPIMDS